MRFARIGAICLVLSACAATQQTQWRECSADSSIAKGSREGASGRSLELFSFQTCSPQTRPAAIQAYREAFSAARTKRLKDRTAAEAAAEKAEEEAQAAEDAALAKAREPAMITWVCEVEANSKIFTGTGGSRDEALGSARATCGSHFQASYCTKSECKQNL